MASNSYNDDIMLVSKHVVAEVGLEGAILLHKIGAWCESNKRNEKNFHDGYYWMYNSVKAFTEEFYFMSRGMVDRYIKKLKDGGYIVTGNYNTNQYDRTLWYAVTEKGYALLNGVNETSDSENDKQEFTKTENTFPENEKSYNNINNTISNEQSINNQSISGDSQESPSKSAKEIEKEEAEQMFEECWKQYPNKKGKSDVSLTQKIKLYKTVGKGKLLMAVMAYSKEVSGRDMHYVLHGDRFFNKRYEDYLDENASSDNPKETTVKKTRWY